VDLELTDRPRRVRPLCRRVAVLALVALCALVSLRAVLGLGLIRGPYPSLGRSLAWWLGVPEAAYNYGVVEEGRVYRSARPDARFLEWMQRRHGIRRVVGLAGPDPVHEVARRLGMEVTTFAWQPSELPPQEELDAVVALLDAGEPVLVHCASGSDRTGYAVAAYRVERMGWTVEEALREMRDHWHDPEQHRDLHLALRARFEKSAGD